MSAASATRKNAAETATNWRMTSLKKQVDRNIDVARSIYAQIVNNLVP